MSDICILYQTLVYMNIGKEIRAHRERLKLNQTQIAEKIGLDTSSYARIEKKGNKLTVEQLEAIAGALGVAVVELLTGEQPTGGNNEETERLKKRVRELEDRLRDKDEDLKLQRKWLNQVDIRIDNFYFECIQLFVNEMGISHKPRDYAIDYSFIDSISDEDMERIFLEKIAYFPFLWECIDLGIIGEPRFKKIKHIRKYSDEVNLKGSKYMLIFNHIFGYSEAA